MKKAYLLLVCSTFLVLTGCKPVAKPDETSPVRYVSDSRFNSIQGRQTRPLLKLPLSCTGIDTFDYTIFGLSNHRIYGSNVSAGLVGLSEFGTPELLFAESINHNNDYSVYTAKLRDDENMIYVNSLGEPYEVDGVKQRVKPTDFVYGLKYALRMFPEYYSDGIEYLKGSVEYKYYWQLIKYQDLGISDYVAYNTPNLKAFWIQQQIKEHYESTYVMEEYDEYPITGADVEDIAQGRRLGIHANNETREIEFQLLESCSFFVPFLETAPYFPVCEEFFKHNSFSKVDSPDKMVYCGPFYPSSGRFTDTDTNYPYLVEINLKRNEFYNTIEGISPANQSYIDEILLTRDFEDTSSAYRNGDIDAFFTTVLTEREYEEHIAGPNGEGTYENPYSDEVSVIYNEKASYYYSSFINIGLHQQYSTYYHDQNNTLRALRINDVRKALLKTFDYAGYFDADPFSPSGHKLDEMVHSLVPRNYCYDASGNEYVDTYLSQAYAEKMGMSLQEAQQFLAPGQYANYKLDDEQINELVDNAMSSIAKYNSSDYVAEYGDISYPVVIEMFSRYSDEESRIHDQRVADYMNTKLNKLINYNGDVEQCNYFRVVLTDKITDYNLDFATRGGFDISGPLWAFTADSSYPDPYSYLRTFAPKYGKPMWSEIYPYLEEDFIPDFIIRNNNLLKTDLFGEYKNLLTTASFASDSLEERYSLMANAEYELLENVNVYQPLDGQGLGYGFILSRMTTVGLPKQFYNQFSQGRLTGLWALEEPLSNEETQTMIEEEKEYQEEYFESGEYCID